MKSFILFLAIVLITCDQYGQKEGNIWYFGDSTIIDFNSNPASISRDAKLWSFTASSSACDKNGKLKYYSNSEEIFDRSGQRIKGWDPQGIGYNDSIDGTLMVALNSDKSLVFAMEFNGIFNPSRLYYSVINDSLNGGLGGMDLMNQYLDDVADKLLAIRHGNGRDWWILSHQCNNNVFIKYLVTETGNILKDTQSAGSDHLGIIGDTIGWVGQMVYDDKWKILAVAATNGVIDILHFDRCSGEISEYEKIELFTNPPTYYYGVSISPNGRFLYVSDQGNGTSTTLWQYDLEKEDFPDSNVSASENVIWNASSVGLTNHQLAPDGKIYIMPYGSTIFSKDVSTINEPDLKGSLCDFQLYGIDISPGGRYLGLPNIPNYRLGPGYSQPANAGADQTICTEATVTLGVPDTSNGRCIFYWSPAWGLNDPTLAQPAYSNQGIDTFFVLTVTDTTVHQDCNSTTDTVWVFHESPWSPPNAPDIEICEDGSAMIGLSGMQGFIYQWDPITGLANPAAATTMAAPGMPMQYVLTVTDTAMKSSCRSVTDTVNVEVAPCYLPGVIAPGDPGFMQKLEITGIPNGTHLSVYDITGRLVFRSYDYANDWPGDGSYAAAGLYVYVVEFAVDPFGPLGTREIRKLLVRN